jgi:NADH-quinone oxidoreductase subunit E
MSEQLSEVFSAYEGRRDELIPILQEVQETYGYLSEEAIAAIARFARVPEANVYAVATFYAQFRFCHVRGAPRILETLQKQLGIEEGETTEDREYSLETVACIGACGLSPCLTINKQVEAKVTPKRVTGLLRTGSGNGNSSG